YTYCSNILLSTDIRSFTATRKEEDIYFQWLTANEKPGTSYELLKSTDGKNFTPVEQFTGYSLTGSGRYSYSYVPDENEKGKMVFRIRQTDARGNIRYSVLRVVDLGSMERSAGMRVLPNPYRNGDITIKFND